jgi:hypothetical protein
MSTIQKLQKLKNFKFVGIGDRALFTKQDKGRWPCPPQTTIFWAMNRVWQFFLSAAAGGDDVRIWQSFDRDGNTWWHGCDRATGRSTYAATDDEMRAWIDRHYYQ